MTGVRDVIIIGSEPGGLYAGIYAAEGTKLQLSSSRVGGTQAVRLRQTTDVENFPASPT